MFKAPERRHKVHSMTTRKQAPNLPLCSRCGKPCGHPPKLTYSESEFPLIAPHGTDSRSTMNFSGFQAQSRYFRIIELLYNDARTGWKTYSDVMRAFVDLGCSHFGAMIGGSVIPGIRHTLQMMNKLIEQARDANDFASSIDALGREVERLVEGNMRESAVGLVYGYREQAKAIPEPFAILKRKLVADINTRFGYLLKGNQGRKDHEKPSVKMGQADPDEREELERYE